MISTPERDLTWGQEHIGPPANSCHVREWNRAELFAFLRCEGYFVERLQLTRSNNRETEKRTTIVLARYTG